MKEKHLFTLLSVEAAACVLFCILQRSLSGLFSTLIAFPFEQIGAGLRAMSLSGTVGNEEWFQTDLRQVCGFLKKTNMTYCI